MTEAPPAPHLSPLAGEADDEVFDVVHWSPGRPASLVVPGTAFVGRETVPLVEVFTAAEQRARTSQAYHRSAVGERLRVSSVARERGATEETTFVVQRDATTGIEARTTLTRPLGVGAIRVETRLTNTGPATVVITAVASASVGFAQTESDLDDILIAVAASEWLAENRWREFELRRVLPALSLDFHGQDGRGRYGITSHGSWPTGERLPVGVLTSTRTGDAIAWQIESGAGWHVDLSQARNGGVLTLLGPTDLEHQFARELLPGEWFDAAPAVIAHSPAGRDGVLAALTTYRRWLRRTRADAGFPVVYNDFMNTLMGQPTTEQLLPLVESAADAGAEVFCIDAGWFADPAIGDWWSTVGEWAEASSRFTGGLREITDAIRARGMRVGIWLEPEVVGSNSPIADRLPEEAFFTRHGARVVEHERYHLDFRHPAARAHVDAVVDGLVAEHGIGYFKLDYNINPGAGTDRDATAAGDGLLGHARAFRDWLGDVQVRHPDVLIENCSSGAMRADYAFLEITHLQSTSDQQDFRLYPPIAASAPASILPEQCGNWAYPAADMTEEEMIFTLVTGLSGRFYLAGFLHELSDAQRELVAAAIEFHRAHRALLGEALPFWPLGLPEWDTDTVCLGLRTDAADLLFVWDRQPTARTIVLPGVRGDAEQVFPAGRPWLAAEGADGLQLESKDGLGARVFRLSRRDARAVAAEEVTS